MKKNAKLLAVLLVMVLLTTALTACGAKSESTEAYAPQANFKGDYAVKEESAMEAPMEAPETEEGFTTADTAAGSSMDAQTTVSFAEKIIYSGHVNIETTKFDDALAALEKSVQELNGFVQDSSVEGYTRTYDDGTTAVVDRWAHYVVRIPTESFDAFMHKTGTIGSVTNSSRSAENVTSQYTDYEARLDSLYLQEERLLDMLAKSGDLESLITLESRLSEVRYEIESIERNLRNLDQRLAYSTVSLNVQEVEIYTPTATVQRTFGEKLSDAFSSGTRSFVRGVQNFILNIARNIFDLLVFAVVVVVIVLVLRRTARKTKAKWQARKQNKNNEEKPEEPKQN